MAFTGATGGAHGSEYSLVRASLAEAWFNQVTNVSSIGRVAIVRFPLGEPLKAQLGHYCRNKLVIDLQIPANT